MIRKHKINKRNLLFLIFLLFSTSLLVFKSFKKIDKSHLKIFGSESFTNEDIIKNSSLIFPTRLIFINTKFLEKELKRNLFLKNISINRQIIPFGLKILIQQRTPIAHGDKVLNGKKIIGFIDKEGFFINQKYVDKNNFKELKIRVYGWQEKSIKILSKILKSQILNELNIIKISFSPNGFLTLEEEDLRTILLGLNKDLIETQLQIIGNLKTQLRQKEILKKIDTIDLTDPNNVRIKVFKP